MSRRFSISVIVVAFATMAASGLANAKVEARFVSFPYERPTGFFTAYPTSGSASFTVGLKEASAQAKPGESLVSVEIIDDTGGTPHGDLHIDHNRDGRVDVHKSFCGATIRPVRIRAMGNRERRRLCGPVP